MEGIDKILKIAYSIKVNKNILVWYKQETITIGGFSIMASIEKVREFFEISKMRDECFSVIEPMMLEMKKDFIEKNDKDGVMTAEFVRRIKKFLTDIMIYKMEYVYANKMSDKDLDELIAFYTSQVFIDMQNSMYRVEHNLVLLLAQNMPLVYQYEEKIAEDLVKEFEDKKSSVH